MPGAHSAPPSERLRTLVRAFGEVVLTAGAVVLLFVVYELFVTDLLADQRQAELVDQLEAEWDLVGTPNEPREGVPGDAIAILHIPRLGEDYRQVVLEGTTSASLAQGPGHYVDTALPGRFGNFSVAGHRDGRGSPFSDLDALLPGDAVVVETIDTWYVYRVLGDPRTGEFTGDPSGIPGRQIVRPQDVQVISPTPNATPAAEPTGTYLTLTTCHPHWSAEERLIIHADLEGAGTPKSELPEGPAALTES